MKDFDRDYWMDAKESVEYGIADQIVQKFKPNRKVSILFRVVSDVKC
jgi:ATP-dependent protease ClpP protease subunit